MTVIDTDDSAQPVVPRPLKLSCGWLAGLGSVAGLGALISSSCCVLPIALAGVGAGSAVFAGLELLVDLRPYLLGGAAAILISAWAVFLRRRATDCVGDGNCDAPAPAARGTALLSVGSAIIGLSIVWDPLIEPVLLKLVR
jgi:mercuric ion transport protein